MLRDVEPTDAERVPLAEAGERTLASDLHATRTQPPFRASAMDGYAVRAGDLPGRLAVVGESAAGRRHEGAIGAGECVRIFTGGVVPDGADAVLIQENARRSGDAVETTATLEPGTYVRPDGLDFREGDRLLRAGRVLDPAAVSLAAAGGHGALSVRRRPRVAIIANGDELVPAGTQPGPDGIVASNGYGVAALVRRAGGEPADLGIAPDDGGRIAALLRRADEMAADVVVTLGGASVGDHDLVGAALRAHGVDLAFMKLAMRPGKPVMFGRRGATAYLGLPGNPVSGLVGAQILLLPILRRLLGQGPETQLLDARLGVDLPPNGDREHYMRARRTENGVVPFENQDSSLLSVLAQSDVLLVRPAGEGARRAGETVRIVPI